MDSVSDETAERLGAEFARIKRGASDAEILAWLDGQTDPDAVTGWAQEACLRGYRRSDCGLPLPAAAGDE